METHSDKGLKTLALLGTIPADWGLVEIKWVEEERMVPVKERCPTCHGIGQAAFEKDGKLAVNEFDSQKEYMKWNERSRKMMSLGRGKCPTCSSKRGPYAHSYGTGEITVKKMRKVWVGYVQWEPNTVFDSRFSHSDCQLCSKKLKWLDSGIVPVHGKDSIGQVHGMWVGEDCARKFLGIKKWKKDKDAVLALDK